MALIGYDSEPKGTLPSLARTTLGKAMRVKQMITKRQPSKPIRLAGDKSRCKVAATVASTKSITTSSEKSEVPEKHHESNETTQTDTEKVGTSRSFKPWEEAIINAYIENGGSQSAAFRIGKPNCLKWTDKSVHNKAYQFSIEARLRRLLSFEGDSVGEGFGYA